MGPVVVTGATGFVGGRLVRRLSVEDEPLVALVRTRSDALAELGVRQVETELARTGALEVELAGAAAVVHVAASIDSDIEKCRRVNRDGTAALVDAALAAGTTRFVQVSTAAVYDRAAAPEVIGEDSPRLADGRSGDHPRGRQAEAYALTKAEAEQVVEAGIERGLSAAILRPPAVLGAGPTSTWGTRVPELARDGKLPPQHPSMTFGWVHVDDLVDAIVAAMRSDAGVTANVVGGHTTWGDYVASIRSLFPGAPPPPDPARDPWTGRYAAHRLAEALGVEPQRSYDEALSEIADWWRPR